MNRRQFITTGALGAASVAAADRPPPMPAAGPRPVVQLALARYSFRDFDELMRQHGVEPVLPGHTEDEGFQWCQDGITACLAKAEACGVMLALENHWGLALLREAFGR